MDIEPVTPYSTVLPYVSGLPAWVSEQDGQRLAAYLQYEMMYWSNTEAFELIREADHGDSLYIPNPKTIVDTTSYYFMKGLQITLEEPDRNQEFWKILKDFLRREKFYSKFQAAKHAGVVRGDFIFHITADPNQPEGGRISINSVDPGAYFPVYDPDDLDKRIGVRLVEQWAHPDDPTKSVVKILEYGYNDNGTVWRTENLWEIEGWNDPKKAKKVKTIHELATLPSDITQIPVYHFRNAVWDGQPFGNSELKGYEKVFSSINQTMSDTDIALALVGLGVYATDAGRPTDSRGREVDWQVSPGKVLEVPGATMFKRLEGITTVTPVLDHVNFLQESIFRASGTSDIALGKVEVTTAESGIALAIKFSPTAAKLEQRDQDALETLTQMFYDLKFWFKAYESWNYVDIEITPKLGEKLPVNRAKLIEELNNMMDRKVISKRYYREKMQELGYEFPENMEDEILEELLREREVMTPPQLQPSEEEEQIGPGGRKVGAGDTLPDNQRSTSNNARSGQVNESRGTEINNR